MSETDQQRTERIVSETMEEILVAIAGEDGRRGNLDTALGVLRRGVSSVFRKHVVDVTQFAGMTDHELRSAVRAVLEPMMRAALAPLRPN